MGIWVVNAHIEFDEGQNLHLLRIGDEHVAVMTTEDHVVCSFFGCPLVCSNFLNNALILLTSHIANPKLFISPLSLGRGKYGTPS